MKADHNNHKSPPSTGFYDHLNEFISYLAVECTAYIFWCRITKKLQSLVILIMTVICVCVCIYILGGAEEMHVFHIRLTLLIFKIKHF